MNAIGPIITKYRKKKHLTQSELSELLKAKGVDVSDKCLYSWESNRTEPGVKQLFTLCKVLGIKDIYEEIFGVNPYNPLNKLNEEGVERANEYVDMLATNDKYKRQNAPVIEVPEKRIINLYELRVSAGTGNYMDNEAYTEIETDKFVPSEADFAVHITGDSMQPLLQDGQIVYVHKTEDLNDGDIGIFALNGDVYCKKLSKTKKETALISLNKKYDPIPIDEESNITALGKVII